MDSIFAIKCLVIDKTDYYSFRRLSEYCIDYGFPHYAHYVS